MQPSTSPDPLDRLLKLVPPAPPSPWFAAKTVAAATASPRNPLHRILRALRPILAPALLSTTALLALALAATSPPSPAPISHTTSALPQNPTDDEILTNLDLYLAQFEDELWSLALLSPSP